MDKLVKIIARISMMLVFAYVVIFFNLPDWEYGILSVVVWGTLGIGLWLYIKLNGPDVIDREAVRDHLHQDTWKNL